MTFTKCNERGIIRVVGWCEAKPTQLKSLGRYSSFPFPHLSPLSSVPGSSLFSTPLRGSSARFGLSALACPHFSFSQRKERLRSLLSFGLREVIEGVHELGGRVYPVDV